MLIIITVSPIYCFAKEEPVQKDQTISKYLEEDSVFLIKEGTAGETVRENQERPYHQFPANMKIGDFVGISDILQEGNALDHYQSVIVELACKRANTNAVSLWSDAKSTVNDGRVWGGFISARSELNKEEDSQLIGLEIDVLNGGLPGEYPNQSKVGLQIVGFGELNTNAIELLTDDKGLWQNAINIQEGSISTDGAILGVAQSTPIKTGIDFSNTPFSNAAMIVNNGSKISFVSKEGNATAIFSDNINNGYMVLQIGKSGLRIVNNENNANLLTLTPDGKIDQECLFYKETILPLGENNTKNSDKAFNSLNIVILVMLVAIVSLICYCINLNKKITAMANSKSDEENNNKINL